MVTAPRLLAIAAAAVAFAPGGLVAEERAPTPSHLVADEAAESERADPTFPRANYVWPFSAGPFYGSLLQERGHALPMLRTIVGDFDLTTGTHGIPDELRSRTGLARQYFIVQVDPVSGMQADVEARIAHHGGTVSAYIPEGGRIARLTSDAHRDLERVPGVIAVEPYHGAFKLHPSIGRAPLFDPFQAVSEVYDLDVRIFPVENAEAIAQAVRELGGAVSAVWPDTIRAELDRSKLAELARIEGVWVVFEHLPVVPFGEETTTTMQTGRYNNGAVPYHDAGIDGSGGGIDGSGQGGFAATPQVLMVLDSGIQLDAADLSHTRVSAGTPGPGHRKVRLYTTVAAFGGDGDLLGCDAGISGGITHGHLVAATAVGEATTVDPGTYGESWYATDEGGGTWKLDGVAPGAVLVAYDAQRTPPAGSCADPLANTLVPGDLYSGAATGSLGDAYLNRGARVFNLSWGSPQNLYDSHAMDVDQFLLDKGNALVIVAAGNRGLDSDNDGEPDPGSLGAPATSKNGLAIGAGRAANDRAEGFAEEERAYFSSTGPAPGGRIAPQLMAPGDEENAAPSFLCPYYPYYNCVPNLAFGAAGAPANMGLRTEYACTSGDNDQADPVECDVRSAFESTSSAAAAASGAALLVRDYFAQGFYPDGTSSDPGNATDQVASVSGVLVKALLVASADFMTGDGLGFGYQNGEYQGGHFPGGDGLTARHRFNNEQGYGRIRLDRALPLQTWPASVSGLLVQDSVGPVTVGGISGLASTVNAQTGGSTQGTFSVCGTDEELRIALVWFDAVGQGLINDLDLEVIAPGGARYRGNYFTDDDDRDLVLDPNEDCPGVDGATGKVSSSAWSLPVCQRANGTLSPFDRQNPTEAVMLSPDPLGTGAHNQIELGTWTVRVSSPGGGGTPAQSFAIAIAGSVCGASWVRLDSTEYACNASAAVTVYEVSESGDMNPGATAVDSRTRLQVLDDGTVVDEETGLGFTKDPASLRFTSNARLLTSSTARDPGNGVLDVREGDTIRVLYQDTTGTRTSDARVTCTPGIAFGGVMIEQYGQDASYLVRGGCERSARGLFEFGFPDRYLDAGEAVTLDFAVATYETAGLDAAEVDLRCVIPDADSPAGCVPPDGTCVDPLRENNASCDQRPSGNPGDVPTMTIFDTPRVLSWIPPDTALTLSFPVRMAASIPGTPEIELVLAIRAATTGKDTPGLAVSRQRLDVDEQSKFYSTDFPTGGTELVDVSGDEVLQNPTTSPTSPDDDYRFETRVWSDLTAGGTKNTSLLSPWNFDTSDGGFRSGILATTSYSTITNTIALWGEDLNFNGIDDKRCSGDTRVACNRSTDCTGIGLCLSIEDRDPLDGALDKSWSLGGGCGWQTRPPATCSNDATRGCFSNSDCTSGATCTGAAPTGGIWHTGRIGGTTGTCLVTGNNPGQCQAYETVGGTQGLRAWREALVTPVIQKVNGDDHQLEIVQWAWNQAADLADNNAALTWELDTDAATVEPVDLYSDSVVLNALFGPYGPNDFYPDSEPDPALTGGYTLFAPLTADMLQSWNGSLGGNRQGKNACFFEGGAILAGVDGPCPGCPYVPGELGWARPLDDDADNDGDGSIDEYVRANGPIRNMDISAVYGPDMRFDKLEDLYGNTGSTFQGALTMMTFERTPSEADPQFSYGVGVDDMVVEWREYALVDDAASCGGGQCASINLQTNVLCQSGATLTVTVVDPTPDPINDCNLDGITDGTTDCNGNGVRDVVARVTSLDEPAGELVVLDAGVDPAVFGGELPFSSVFDAPGILSTAGVPEQCSYPTAYGTACTPPVDPVVTAIYEDRNDGTGMPCGNSIDPALRGRVEAQLTIEVRRGEIVVIDTLVTGNGDGDAFADTNETIEVRLHLLNLAETDLTGVTAHVTTTDPKIDCILRSAIHVGDLPAGASATTTEGVVVRVAGVDRAALGLTAFDDFSATFDVTFSADQFEANGSNQSFTLDLDLDASGGSGPTTFFEGFESGTFGAFEGHNMDRFLNNLAASDGYRCQYSDPDWPNSNSYGQITDCFLGANQAHADAFFWQINTPANPNNGKAFSGNNSLYMGIFGPTADWQTTPVSVMEAVRLRDPINLGYLGPSPELSMKHQVDFYHFRGPDAAADRAIVALQLADAAGQPVGNWIKLEPYLNVYESGAIDLFFNCTFDPIDDGNTEDDFFDATDPDRRLGPSSTCVPQLSFTFVGDTFYPFDPARIGGAPHGPGLQGSLGVGTWVEVRFSLERFRGRRARLRFLNTSLKVNGTNTTWASLYTSINPGPEDDGWWIDDVQITNTLAQPATIASDVKPNVGLPDCGNTCNVVTAHLAADPPGVLSAPGQVVELDALASTADRCIGGVLQYRFWVDGNGDDLGGGAQDVRLRGWSETASVVQAPGETTAYLVEVRCSSAPNCRDTASRTVVVACPSSGSLTFPAVHAPSKSTLSWSVSRTYDYAVGLLANLSSYMRTRSGQAAGPASSFSISGDVPGAGAGFWYLFRDTGPLGQGATGYCNAPGITWGNPTRDSVLP